MAFEISQSKPKEKETFELKQLPSSREEIENKKYYVVMTDKFMSNWGQAEGKTNKFIIGCDTLQEAETIKHNAEKRPEMKYININYSKPHYNKNRVKVSYRNYNELGEIWHKKEFRY